jgi:pyridoxal/pyridoxine/pyridoxamine kinase
LTGISIKKEDDIFSAIEKLHSMGPKTVIIKSSNIKNPQEIDIYGSTIGKLIYFSLFILFRFLRKTKISYESS